jgi:hypothetical protein
MQNALFCLCVLSSRPSQGVPILNLLYAYWSPLICALNALAQLENICRFDRATEGSKMHFRKKKFENAFLTGRLRYQNGWCFRVALVHSTRKLRGFNMHTTDLRLELPPKIRHPKHKHRIMILHILWNALCIKNAKCIIEWLHFELPLFGGNSILKHVMWNLKPLNLRVKCTNATWKHQPFWSRNRRVKNAFSQKKKFENAFLTGRLRYQNGKYFRANLVHSTRFSWGFSFQKKKKFFFQIFKNFKNMLKF